jgi:hypothetical protein
LNPSAGHVEDVAGKQIWATEDQMFQYKRAQEMTTTTDQRSHMAIGGLVGFDGFEPAAK